MESLPDFSKKNFQSLLETLLKLETPVVTCMKSAELLRPKYLFIFPLLGLVRGVKCAIAFMNFIFWLNPTLSCTWPSCTFTFYIARRLMDFTSPLITFGVVVVIISWSCMRMAASTFNTRLDAGWELLKAPK